MEQYQSQSMTIIQKLIVNVIPPYRPYGIARSINIHAPASRSPGPSEGGVSGVMGAIALAGLLAIGVLARLGTLTGEHEHPIAAGVALLGCSILLGVAVCAGWWIGRVKGRPRVFALSAAMIAVPLLYFFAFNIFKEGLAPALSGGLIESLEHPERRGSTFDTISASVGQQDGLPLPEWQPAPRRGKAPDLIELDPDAGDHPVPR